MHVILDPYPEFLGPCDLPSSDAESDPEAESEIEPGRLSSLARRQQLRDRASGREQSTARTVSQIGQTQDSQPPLATVGSSRNLELDSDLNQMQAILNRLAERQIVLPDEWWTGAGLSRVPNRQGNADLGTDSGDGSVRQRL